MSNPTLAEVKATLRNAGFLSDEGTTRDDHAAIVLLSSAIVGTAVDRLRNFTGVPRSEIREFAVNLRRSGVWIRGEVASLGWHDPEAGGIEFALDVACALGLMERVRA